MSSQSPDESGSSRSGSASSASAASISSNTSLIRELVDSHPGWVVYLAFCPVIWGHPSDESQQYHHVWLMREDVTPFVEAPMQRRHLIIEAESNTW